MPRITEHTYETATVTAPGNPRAGIPGTEIRIEWPGLFALMGMISDTGREAVRTSLREFFDNWLDGKPRVVFGDECPGCQRKRADCHCPPDDRDQT